MLGGDNGVLTKGAKAAEESTYSQAEEELNLIVSGATVYWKDAKANDGLTQTYLEYFDVNYATGETLEEKGNIRGKTGAYTYTSNNGTVINFALSDTGKLTIISNEDGDSEDNNTIPAGGGNEDEDNDPTPTPTPSTEE